METFTEPRALIARPAFEGDRREALRLLNLEAIDPPIVDIITAFAEFAHVFTIQCCFGHFVCGAEQDVHTLSPIPDDYAGPVRYRIAYVAFCLEPSERGRALYDAMARVPQVDPGYIQFGCATWFWDRWPNSYALQVEPAAFRFQDEAMLDVEQARRTAAVRDAFFARLRTVLAEERRRVAPA